MASQAKTGGVTKPQLIAIGRPNGPDLQLKIAADELILQPAGATSKIIKPDSSITEVLNVISFLISPTRTVDAMVEDEPGTNVEAVGETDPVTGYYLIDTATPITNATVAGSAFCTIDLITPPGDPPSSRFPVSILKRRGPATDANSPNTFDDMTDKQITADPAGRAAVTGLLSDCVKQMILILQQTRKILGPRGWTDLFQKVTGGSSANKKAKRTHRHRRKYSSKQY